MGFNIIMSIEILDVEQRSIPLLKDSREVG